MRLSQKIAETLMRRASEGKITPLERTALTWHLEEDAVSRDRALELARFIHEESPRPRQDTRRAAALQRKVMEIAAAELEKESWREAEGSTLHKRSGNIGMAPAVVLAAVTVVMITFLTLPKPEVGLPGSSMISNGAAASSIEPEIEKAPQAPVPVSSTATVVIEGKLKTTYMEAPTVSSEAIPVSSSPEVSQP